MSCSNRFEIKNVSVHILPKNDSRTIRIIFVLRFNGDNLLRILTIFTFIPAGEDKFALPAE